MSELIDFPGIDVIPDPAAERHAMLDQRAQAIEEAPRTLASDKVAVLMLQVRRGDPATRHLQIAFQHSETALVTLDGARMLHRQLEQLLAIADGRPLK